MQICNWTIRIYIDYSHEHISDNAYLHDHRQKKNLYYSNGPSISNRTNLIELIKNNNRIYSYYDIMNDIH